MPLRQPSTCHLARMKPMTAAESRRLHCLALPLLLIAGAHPGCADELPSAPSPQISTQVRTATLAGTITDSNGGAIVGARITLTSNVLQAPDALTALSTDAGRFSFGNVPPGPFTLSIAASGFAPRQTSGELRAGETRELATIALRAGFTTSISVTATQTEIAQAQVRQEEKQRIFGVIPNFYVSYVSNAAPLSRRQKLDLGLRTMVDPVSFVFAGVTAGVEQADNAYAWGQGAQGYAKRYAVSYGTFMTGNLFGNAIFPIVFRQDPRYFYKGTGSIHSRLLYALANAVICKSDNQRWQPNYSGILGSLAASGLSNLYYPAVNRGGLGLTFEGVAIGTGLTAFSIVMQEFVIRKLTPHIPALAPSTP